MRNCCLSGRPLGPGDRLPRSPPHARRPTFAAPLHKATAAEEAPGGPRGALQRQSSASQLSHSPTGDRRRRGRSGPSHPRGRRRPQTREPGAQGQPAGGACPPREVPGPRPRTAGRWSVPSDPHVVFASSTHPQLIRRAVRPKLRRCLQGSPSPRLPLQLPGPRPRAPHHTKDKHPCARWTGARRGDFQRRRMSERGRRRGSCLVSERRGKRGGPSMVP